MRTRRYRLPWITIAGLLLAACSAGGQAVSPAALPPTPTAMPPLATPPAGTSTSLTLPPPQPTWVTQLPPSTLGLSGRLIFTEGPLGVVQWDLAANRISAIFAPPLNGVVNAASLSPDGKTIVMAYGPPPPPGKPQLGYTSLYTVPSDSSSLPVPLIPGDHPHEFFFTPRWSADGKFIYYGHYIETGQPAGATPGFYLERRPYPGGDPTVITSGAFVPYLSRDGSRLAYITVDPQSYLNNLFTAGVDGSNAASLLKPGTLWAIDSLTISPDGSDVVFSGDSNGPTASRPDIYTWLGIQPAQAHSIPEDLWQIPTAGGPVTRLTTIGTVGLAADYAPDGAHIVFIGQNGVYVIKSDGSGLTQLDGEPKFGSIQWAP